VLRTFSRRGVIAGIGALTLASALSLGTALAQPPDTSSAGPSMFQSFVSKLSAKLGKSEAEVQAAIAESQRELLEDVIQRGGVPPERADQLRARLQNGPAPFSPLQRFGHRGGEPKASGPGFGPGAFALGPVGHHIDAVTSFLGVTRAELAAEMRAGKSLATIAQEKGKSRDDLKATILAETEKALRERSQGRASEEQIQQFMDRIRSGIDRMIDATPAQFKFRGPMRSGSSA
jgi:hypothetical protein